MKAGVPAPNIDDAELGEMVRRMPENWSLHHNQRGWSVRRENRWLGGLVIGDVLLTVADTPDLALMLALTGQFK